MSDLYVEGKHPVSGDPMWRFQCGGMDALNVMQQFLDKYPHPDYTLSVFNTLTDWSDIEILDVPFQDLVKIIEFIYHQEHSEPIAWIGVNSLSDSYVVAMPLTRGRVRGGYKVVDGKLAALEQ